MNIIQHPNKVSMECTNCHAPMNKFGFVHNKSEKIQRFRCKQCKTTATEERTLGDIRVDTKTVIKVVHMLCEGVGIRACERLCDIHRDTVMNILEFAGQRCIQTFNNHVINVAVKAIQIDELYAFVFKKERNCESHEVEFGDQYTYLAIDPESKLILGYLTGKRDQTTTDNFIRDLGARVDKEKQFDITSDGFPCYNNPIADQFYANAAYAQLVKNFHLLKIAKQRGEPLPCIERNLIFGQRQNQSISTSYVERLNLTLRIFNRRFTRKTIGYSKKLGSLKHSVALFVAHYNFCRVHSSLNKQTPAMAAGLTERPFSIGKLLCIES